MMASIDIFHPLAACEIFKLTLDGDAPENQPLEMVRRDGYKSDKWLHTGVTLAGVLTRCFKLVYVGYCRCFQELRHKITEHGRIPEGQWREAYKKNYAHHAGKHCIGIADNSWKFSGGGAGFPYISEYGTSLFFWAGGDFLDYWWWLVEVSGESYGAKAA